MKKMFVALAALIFAAACGTPTTNTPPPTLNANSAATPSAAVPTEADAIAKEKAVWDTIKIKDYDAFANMLAEDQLEVMGEAVYDKAGSVASVKEFEPTDLTFSDWKFLSVDKDAYVITYTVNTKGKYRGKEFPPETARCSSAWVNRNGKWLAIYHQESPVAPPMPPPPASKTAAPKASPASTASPVVATTGSDPIANEKLVWDLFKSKSFDAFEALLAPEFIEVEPDKVYNKSESVEALRSFDATKGVLSDWKTVKIDDDASLVTYVAKVPYPKAPPLGERHSTIWVNRDGKWLGLFHHGGTPVAKPGTMAAASPSVSPAASPSPRASVSPAAKASPRTSPAVRPTP
ncbi:MAG TPA: nuclear transport factor 2 family protein [Pyrinomonadaceae bacterium]|jgi:hypothetical protein